MSQFRSDRSCTGYLGVYPVRDKFEATIHHDRKFSLRQHLGSYDTAEEAAHAVAAEYWAANVTQAEIPAAAAEGAAAGEDALYWREDALLDWSDERGREVSGIKLGDAVTAFLDEGGEMSIDAHGGCSLHGCSLLQLRRYNELQLQHHHQHQQGLSRPSEPERWQPTHMRCGAFFVPVCEHCYHEDCEGECLEVDPADSEAWAQMRRHQRRHGW